MPNSDITEISTNKMKIDLSEVHQATKTSIPQTKPKKDKTKPSVKTQQRFLKSLSSDGPSQEKQELIMIIKRYQSNPRFKQYIKKDLGIDYSHSSLTKKSINGLKDILEKIRVNLNNRNVSKMMDSVGQSTSVAYETVLSEFYDIEGFTDNLWGQENFLDVWEKLKIETTMPNIPPMVQVGLIVLQTTMLTHELNKLKQRPVEMKGPSEEDMKIIDEDEKNIS